MSDELPNGWAVAPLSTIATSRMGKTIIGHELSAEGIPVYSAGRDSGPWGHIATSDVVFPRGTLVVSARGTIGFVRLPDDDGFVSTQTTIAVRPTAALLPEFLRYALLGVDWSQITSATTIPMLTIRQLDAVRVLVPPASEQRRIVAKLDALLARSKKAREHLDRIPALLDALKRSILAAAFRGDLTADWRKVNPDVEPATKLLERIRAERRRRWEDELRAKGKDPKKAKYEEPAPVDESELPELPEGWCWATLEDVGPMTSGGTPSRTMTSYYGGGIRWVKTGELNDSVLIDTEETLTDDGVENSSAKLLPKGTLLIAMYGATIGMTSILGVPATTNQACAAILPVQGFPDVLVLLQQYVIAQRAELRAAGQGGAQPNLSQGYLRRLAVPLVPMAEAEVLLARLRSALARVDRLVTSMAHVLAGCRNAESAALAAAFRGELVPQDPDDEPAEAMLARLRASTPAPAAKAPRAVPRAKRSASAPPEPAPSMGDALDVVVGALVAAKRMTAEQVRAATGLGKDDVTPVLKGLVATGKVRVEGKARGTTYRWMG